MNSSFGEGLVFDPYACDLLVHVLSMIASIQGLILVLVSQQPMAAPGRGSR